MGTIEAGDEIRKDRARIPASREERRATDARGRTSARRWSTFVATCGAGAKAGQPATQSAAAPATASGTPAGTSSTTAQRATEAGGPGGAPSSTTDGRITIDDFAKVELRVGQVKSAEKVKGADKLLKL